MFPLSLIISGVTLHDLRFDGRSTFYRLSLSEMFVPYGDPRNPIHRKAAFDLGNIGAGVTANNLQRKLPFPFTQVTPIAKLSPGSLDLQLAATVSVLSSILMLISWPSTERPRRDPTLSVYTRLTMAFNGK
jgi:hypothetical protein